MAWMGFEGGLKPSEVNAPWEQMRPYTRLGHFKFGLLVCFLICGLPLVAATAVSGASSQDNLNTSPNPDIPTQVDVSFFIDDISDIDLSAGDYKIVGQMVLEWKDPRLAFTPDPKHPHRPRDLDAEAAKELLKKIWQPVFEISNEQGERKTGVLSLNIWPDGRVRYYEKFDSLPDFHSNLRLYPYGSVDLDLLMTGFLQDRSELVYRMKSFEFQNSTKPVDFIHGHWSFVSMEAKEKAVKRSDDRSVDYSQIHYQINLKHESIQAGALTIFIPLCVIFFASCALLWLDPAKSPSYSSPRLGGTLTLILTTIALKFSLTKQIPTLHYLTMTDLLMIETISLLVISLVCSCIYIWLYSEKSQTIAVQFNKTVRAFYHFLFLSVVAVSILIIVFHQVSID